VTAQVPRLPWGRGLSLALFACGAMSPPSALAQSLHPSVPLLDVDAQPVVESGRPIDVRQTCGGDCHDVAFIEANSYHAEIPAEAPATSRWDLGLQPSQRFLPLVHQRPEPSVDAMTDPNWVGGDVGRPMNCMLCHIELPNRAARERALRAGRVTWEVTATLEGDLVRSDGPTRWRYVESAFSEDGSVSADALRIVAPRTEHCTGCHGGVLEDRGGVVSVSSSVRVSRAWASADAYDATSIHASGLNVENKYELTRPFDVHAERLMECTDCHYSINNPMYRSELDSTRPAHLRFDGRRQTIAEFIRRPSHHFATGSAVQSFAGSAVRDSMRRCGDCHAAEETHDWLPYRDRHLQKVACETCHVPRVDVPVLETVDWTVLTSSTSPRMVFRGTESSPDDVRQIRAPFRPVWLQRKVDGQIKLTPNNLVTQVFWVAGEPESPVALDVLRALWFDHSGTIDDRWNATFDLDGDGSIDAEERILRRPEQVAAMRSALEEAGLAEPRIVAEVSAFGIHHGVTGRDHALDACTECHAAEAASARPVVLARVLPPEAEIAWTAATPPLGTIESTARGGIEFRPDARIGGLHLFGRHRVAWIDGFGIFACLFVLTGGLAHAAARIISSRGRR